MGGRIRLVIVADGVQRELRARLNGGRSSSAHFITSASERSAMTGSPLVVDVITQQTLQDSFGVVQ